MRFWAKGLLNKVELSLRKEESEELDGGAFTAWYRLLQSALLRFCIGSSWRAMIWILVAWKMLEGGSGYYRDQSLGRLRWLDTG